MELNNFEMMYSTAQGLTCQKLARFMFLLLSDFRALSRSPEKKTLWMMFISIELIDIDILDRTGMITYKKAKLIKSDEQKNNIKYKEAINITEYHDISKLIFLFLGIM